MSVCSISIDIDPIPCYYRIHGLGAPPPELRDVVMRRAIPRFAELLGELGVRATFFVVAQDVDVASLGATARGCREVVRELAEAGHEIASHSYSHPYEMARLSQREVAAEIEHAHVLLGEASGVTVRGFRAPGYDLSPAMLGELAARGYHYDSSVFPAPAYYLAKAAVMGALIVARRPSGAVLTNPRHLLSPPVPYRPDLRRPWRRGDAPLVELPIAVTPWGRVPAIGTNLLLAPPWLRARWIAAMASRPHFNFELHGIDLCDAEDDGIPGILSRRQPDLRVPVQRKLESLRACIEIIRQQFEFARLIDFCDRAAKNL